MLAAFVVLLREGFEAGLLVAIVLAYLTQIDHAAGRRQVWYGVGAAIALSLVLAGLLFTTAGELRGPAEKVFEACALFLAVGFLTYMVLWMGRESHSGRQKVLTACQQFRWTPTYAWPAKTRTSAYYAVATLSPTAWTPRPASSTPACSSSPSSETPASSSSRSNGASARTTA